MDLATKEPSIVSSFGTDIECNEQANADMHLCQGTPNTSLPQPLEPTFIMHMAQLFDAGRISGSLMLGSR
jgi:hypothetical protein